MLNTFADRYSQVGRRRVAPSIHAGFKPPSMFPLPLNRCLCLFFVQFLEKNRENSPLCHLWRAKTLFQIQAKTHAC